MRPARPVVLGLALAATGLLASAALSAQEAPTNMAHTHIGHVADSFRGTPDEQGLLAVALAEARTAVEHVGLGLRDPSNLGAMKTHAGHVLHAIDPTREDEGPGLGYGAKRATEGVAQHLGMAAAVDVATQNVKTHTRFVTTALENVKIWADQIIPLAEEAMAATEAWQARSALEQIQILATQMVRGVDANDDGRVTWEAFEGGLVQAERHVDLLKRGEGLGSTP